MRGFAGKACALLLAACAVSVFAEDIENRLLKWSLPSTAKREGDALVFHVAGDAAKRKNVAKASLDLRPYLGKELSITMKVRAKGLTKADAHWLGPSFCVCYKDEFTRQMYYPGFRFPKGDFDGEYTLTVPLYGVNPCDAQLWIGLDSVGGEISFDLGSIRFAAAQKLFPPKNAGYKVRYPDRLSNCSALRGVGVDPALKEKDFADLASWGSRLIRYPLDSLPETRADTNRITKAESIARFRHDTETRMAYLEEHVVGWARKYGVKIALMLPYGPHEGQANIYNDDVCFEAFRDMWKSIAARLKGRTDVFYGYDLINEPSQQGPMKYGYFGLQEKVARAVREADPDATIIIEANNCDAPDAYCYLTALDLDNVIYSVHVYQPMDYTHQLVGGARKNRCAYPRAATGSSPAVDRDYLRRVLEPVRKFQLEHDCRIWVGEFSVAAWAEGGAQYLDDLMSLFHEYGWDWTYLAFRSATLWSVEHGATDSGHRWKAKENTDRKKVLLKWMNAAPSAVAAPGGNRLSFPEYVQRVAVSYPTETEARASGLTLAPLPDDASVAFGCRWDDSTPAHLVKSAMMKKAGVPGTFFLNAKSSGNFAKVLEGGRILADGNAFGNHTFSHPKIWGMSPEETFYEVIHNKALIESASGWTVVSYAAPYGWGREPVAAWRKPLADLLLASGHWVVADNASYDLGHAADELLMCCRMQMNDREAPAPAWFDKQRDEQLEKAKAKGVPYVIFGIHSWCSDEETAKQGVLLEKESHHDDWCYLNANDYGAYRYSALNGRVRRLSVQGREAVFEVVRFDPAQLGSTIALSLKPSGNPVTVKAGGRKLTAGKRGTWTLPHAEERRMPGTIELLGADGRSVCFPGLSLAAAREGTNVRLTVANGTKQTLTGIAGVAVLLTEDGSRRQVAAVPKLGAGEKADLVFPFGGQVFGDGLPPFAVELDFSSGAACARIWFEGFVKR